VRYSVVFKGCLSLFSEQFHSLGVPVRIVYPAKVS
jgi:hypothetical protein